MRNNVPQKAQKKDIWHPFRRASNRNGLAPVGNVPDVLADHIVEFPHHLDQPHHQLRLQVPQDLYGGLFIPSRVQLPPDGVLDGFAYGQNLFRA